MDLQQTKQQQQQQRLPVPFWNSVSARVSEQMWLPSSSSYQAKDWGQQATARGWGKSLRWSSRAEVRYDIEWLLDHDTAEERPAKRQKLEKAAAQKARKIRLYPTAEQKKILLNWMGAARWTYNECLRAIEDEGVPRSKKALRARAINNEATETLKKPWLQETPYDIRDAAMDDLLKAFNSGAARYKNDKKLLRSGTALAKSAFRRALSSIASTGRAAVGSTPFFGI
ncbi:hypothetical protein POJ06DRAFT_38767 [Lipomyces tetrasporus]|uniref:Transposase putative helix-turn-helix domain-containing protein n=1 Tax=Lipomyces tetrasporus TaxID=54092 RepID=A0AAD7VQ18_9ASCO|nr:uncharacterized protein POJ06DRAFT_38767 [Lipomyces tetrasporus]KAJ8097044.1 hypothetical protein POJ06DRAFT_38767 [Lipomyces tetrasporus]